jgi:hypothetical protein
MDRAERIESVECALDSFRYLERTGVEVCKCSGDYICGYHKLEIVLEELKGTKTPKTGKKIRCINTGVVYNTILNASIDTKVHSTNISMCCNGKLKSAGKYLNQPREWEFVE